MQKFSLINNKKLFVTISFPQYHPVLDGLLKWLDLRGNQIRDEGAQELAVALQKNTTLTALNLGNNEIGDQGAKELAEALSKNTTLTLLFLWHNRCENYIVAENVKSFLSRNNKMRENL